MSVKTITTLLITVVLSGCASTSALYSGIHQAYSPTHSVSILQNPPKRPYKIIAELETRGIPGMSYKTMLNNMKTEAKSIGANAIISIKEIYLMSDKTIYRMPHRSEAVVRPPVRTPALTGTAIRYLK
ncbi:hypothetical protein [Acidihalobacter yilgarnensis]|nr:hypothetical protein [Acidihalobacter yilgarnensis]